MSWKIQTLRISSLEKGVKMDPKIYNYSFKVLSNESESFQIYPIVVWKYFNASIKMTPRSSWKSSEGAEHEEKEETASWKRLKQC